MDSRLQPFEQMIRTGMKRSKQASYRRRAPTAESLPLLTEARANLQNFVKECPNSEEAWRLLALVEESLLHYRNARHCLNQAMTVSGKRERRDLKKLARYGEYEEEWRELALNPVELEELGNFLSGRLGCSTGNYSRIFTEQWLRQRKPQQQNQILSALDRRGAFTDFQVLGLAMG